MDGPLEARIGSAHCSWCLVRRLSFGPFVRLTALVAAVAGLSVPSAAQAPPLPADPGAMRVVKVATWLTLGTREFGGSPDAALRVHCVLPGSSNVATRGVREWIQSLDELGMAEFVVSCAEHCVVRLLAEGAYAEVIVEPVEGEADCHDESVALRGRPPVRVPLVALLVSPKEYDGKYVETTGVYKGGAEISELYPSQEMYELRLWTEHAVSVAPAEGLFSLIQGELSELGGWFITVHGMFRADEFAGEVVQRSILVEKVWAVRPPAEKGEARENSPKGAE